QPRAREAQRLVPRDIDMAEARRARTLGILGVEVSELAAVAQEHAVHRGVVAHPYALELAVPRSGVQVAAHRAVRADGRADLEIPDAAAVAERLVGEHAGGAELDEVPGERAFERALLEA